MNRLLFGSTLIAGMLASRADAQTHLLAETVAVGDCQRVTLRAEVSGKLKLTRDGKPAELGIASSSAHSFDERWLPADASSRRAARVYREASAANGGKTQRSLRPDRRLVVVVRSPEGLSAYAPAGPFTRGELELVAEHFDTMALPGLLPGKSVAVGDTWKLDPATAQALCLFDGLTANGLSATFKNVKDGAAVVAISGGASGIENGSSVAVEVAAEARFDLVKKRIVALNWTQRDTRDQGPATPASELTMTLALTRETLAEAPKEFAPTALAGVDSPPAHAASLEYLDPQGRYSLTHARNWHVVGTTDRHLILRLMDRGEFVAQATVIPWNKLAAGKRVDVGEFRKAVSESPGWAVAEVIEAGELPAGPGRWTYRLVASGELEGVKVVQAFYALAGPEGDHVVATFTMKPANAAKVGDRDSALVGGIQFPKGK